MKRSSKISSKNVDKEKEKRSQKYRFTFLRKSLEAYEYIINTLKAQDKHISCPHPYSCAHYILTVRIMM
jgi:hypothetical protein